MARPRKRHIQQDLLDPTGTKPKARRGGKRKGAGRPPKGKRAGSPHKTRPAFKASQPLHIVLPVVDGLQLRRRKLFWAIRWATVTAVKWEDCRIVHASVQQTHVHLIVEAANKRALARGIKAFEISAAKRINAALGRRRGQVFADRYHLEVISSPRQARRALAYVLNNWRKHREDAGRSWNVDPFSSGWSFDGWKQREREMFLWKPPETYLAMVTWYPKTWLLTTGWRQHGLIDFQEVPSSRRVAVRLGR